MLSSAFLETLQDPYKVDEPDIPRLHQQLLDDLKKSPLDGSTHTTILQARGPCGDRQFFMVLIGEIHGNPGQCPRGSHSTDVIMDIIVKYMVKYEPVVLIVESFFHMESPELHTMAHILEDMRDRKYPFELLSNCRPGMAKCIYQNGCSALKFLRTWVAAVRYAAAAYPDSPSIQSLDNRIFAFDLREDIPMPPPRSAGRQLGRENKGRLPESRGEDK